VTLGDHYAKVGYQFSAVVTHDFDQRSYSTLGPVSAWVGDCLWTGKPPGSQVYSAQARPLWVGSNECPVKAGAVNRHVA